MLVHITLLRCNGGAENITSLSFIFLFMGPWTPKIHVTLSKFRVVTPWLYWNCLSARTRTCGPVFEGVYLVGLSLWFTCLRVARFYLEWGMKFISQAWGPPVRPLSTRTGLSSLYFLADSKSESLPTVRRVIWTAWTEIAEEIRRRNPADLYCALSFVFVMISMPLP